MDIYQRINAIRVELIYTHDMAKTHLGEYHDDLKLIKCRPNLTKPWEVAILHHEYVHALKGDRCTNPLNERTVWREAAKLIIDAEKYAAIEHYTLDPKLIANELGTTTLIVRSYQEALALGHRPALLAIA